MLPGCLCQADPQVHVSSPPSASSSINTTESKLSSRNHSGTSTSLSRNSPKTETREKWRSRNSNGGGIICLMSRSLRCFMSSVWRNLWLLSLVSRPSLLPSGISFLTFDQTSDGTDFCRKPLPLTTVELQQSGSRLLHMTPKRILDVS